MIRIRSRIYTIVLISISIICLLTPEKVGAHAGGGPPFIQVNTEYAITNPLFESVVETGLIVPQDITNVYYVKGNGITFEIIPERMIQFGLDENETAKTEFKWSFFEGPDFEKEILQKKSGLHIKQVFESQGSFLVTLEAKTPDDTVFVTLDTILINVVPTVEYKLPVQTVEIDSSLKTESPTTFIDTTKGDIAQVLWGFETGVKKGSKVTHIFDQEYYYDVLIARIVTKEGIISDKGILVVADNGNLAFTSAATKSPTDGITIKKSSSFQLVLLVLPLLLAVGGIILFVTKRK